MFHFPTFPPTALYIQAEVTGHDSSRVSPFGHPWITARLSAPQGFSQTPTSFIGFWCQGIHRVPLLTWPHKTRCSRPLCSSQGTGGTPVGAALAGAISGSPSADRAPTEKPMSVMLTGLGHEETVARPFRTQQRVKQPLRAPVFHSPRGCTSRRASCAAPIDVPPMSYLGRTCVCTRGSARPANRSSGAP